MSDQKTVRLVRCCEWCGMVFESKAQAMEHICDQNPFGRRLAKMLASLPEQKVLACARTNVAGAEVLTIFDLQDAVEKGRVDEIEPLLYIVARH